MTERTLVFPPPAASALRRLGFLLPVAVFVMVAVGLGIGLTRNPQEIPSALIGKPVPDFALPPVQGRSLGLSSTDLEGEVSLVNVFASWCTACRYEHPLFMQLEEAGVVPIHGLNYKDRPEDAANWLDELGDPYTRDGHRPRGARRHRMGRLRRPGDLRDQQGRCDRAQADRAGEREGSRRHDPPTHRGAAAMTGAQGYLSGLVVALATTLPAVAVSIQPARAQAPAAVHESPRPLPDIKFENDQGEALSLADFRGKLVLLNIWATWCAPCRREMPTLKRLQAELGGPDFEVVALSLDRKGLSVVQVFYAELGLETLPIYVDASGEAQRALSVLGLPTTLLLDRDGNEIGRLLGPAEWDSPQMVGFFREYLKRSAADEERDWSRLVQVDRNSSSQARNPFLPATGTHHLLDDQEIGR
jgi:DsbE subfamily thiol:disulfide oxidoreductase